MLADECHHDVGKNTWEGLREFFPDAKQVLFTATPTEHNLQQFGRVVQRQTQTNYRPFHAYTMDHAIRDEVIFDIIDQDNYYDKVRPT